MNILEVYERYLDLLKDHWSSSLASSLLTPELLEVIRTRFHNCTISKKIRILTSFLFISNDFRQDNMTSLEGIVSLAITDRDEWVKVLGRLFMSYITTGKFDEASLDSSVTGSLIRHISFKLTNTEEFKDENVWNVIDDMIRKLNQDDVMLLRNETFTTNPVGVNVLMDLYRKGRTLNEN